MEKAKSYRDLEIWKKGMVLVKDIYEVTGKFPGHEQYALTSQMRRSAVSIPSNAAEGFRRFHNREYKQFLYVLLGSAAELETQISIAAMLNYLSSETENQLLERTDHI